MRTIRLVKHGERGNFPMILDKIGKNLLRGGDVVKIWCNSPLCILWVRKGKPTDEGIHLGGVESIL